MDSGSSLSSDTPAVFQSGPGDYPPRPVLKRDGFELCNVQFTVSGFARMEGQPLKELFNPEIRKTGQQKARKEANKLFKKQFFAAQLRHYDIKFKASGKVGEIRGLLESSLQQGQLCDRLPDSMILFHRKMLSDYSPLQQEWESDVSAWEARKKQHDAEALERKKRLEEEGWNRCTTPQQRANHDFDRFLRYHYLSDVGKPDSTKTSEVVAVRASMVVGKGFAYIQRAVPGIGTAVCRDKWGTVDTVYIGWDHSAVMRAVQEEEEKEKEERKRQEEEKKKRLQAEWDKTVEPHRQYLAQDKSSKGIPQTFELQQCIGSYIVRCDKLSGNWSVLDALSLDVCAGIDGTLIANYNFSILEGTMLLSSSEEKLNQLAMDLDTNGDESDDCYECPEDNPYKDRKWTASGELVTPDHDPRPAKRQRTAPRLAVPRRVHFTMRGRETGEGEMFFTPEPGHLDFLDDTCTKFTGIFYCRQYLCRNVTFEGYRISDQPRAQPEAWSTFSESNYSKAEGCRWGGWWHG